MRERIRLGIRLSNFLRERASRLNFDSGSIIFWIIFIIVIMAIIDSSQGEGNPNAPECYQGPFGYECG